MTDSQVVDDTIIGFLGILRKAALALAKPLYNYI